MKKNKYDIDTKNNTLNYNLDFLINNIKQNADEISEGYSQFLIARLEMLKDKKKKYSGINKQKGYMVKDVFNGKTYISMRDAERKTGINVASIANSIINNTGIQKSYKFEYVEKGDK